MKTYALSDHYQIVEIDNAGEKIKICLNQEGIKEQDNVFLSNHLDLQSVKYEVVKVQTSKGLVYADLAKIPVKETA